MTPAHIPRTVHSFRFSERYVRMIQCFQQRMLASLFQFHFEHTLNTVHSTVNSHKLFEPHTWHISSKLLHSILTMPQMQPNLLCCLETQSIPVYLQLDKLLVLLRTRKVILIGICWSGFSIWQRVFVFYFQSVFF